MTEQLIEFRMRFEVVWEREEHADGLPTVGRKMFSKSKRSIIA